MPNLISIIILTYNQLKYTKLCIESIKTWTEVPYELILVDNGSSDGTVEYLTSIADVKLITNQTNLGFSKGVNQGIKAADGDHIMLLNNDTIVANNWLKNQLRCIDSKLKVGIVGPRSNCARGKPGTIECNLNGLEEIVKFSNNFNKPDVNKWFELNAVAGFCMLIKRKVIEKIGLFDEDFEYGLFEDRDYCCRARENGFKVYCAGDTFVYHFGHRTFEGNNLPQRHIFNKNMKRFKQKWK